MPRKARQKSSTGIYHIIQRGINKQNLFQDEEDKATYLERLLSYKKTCGFKLYAYCLMDNHIHLLIKEEDVCISSVMKRIGASYVYWYNWKYNRVGHLFQDRYKSEPVEDDSYLLTVLRYIHQNPVKVGLTIDTWTSYDNYLSDSEITDVEPLLKLFSNDINTARLEFVKHMNEKTNDICLEITDIKRITDEEAKEIAKNLGLSTYQELHQMDKVSRNNMLRLLKGEGLSIRQLERLSGISRGVILNA